MRAFGQVVDTDDAQTGKMRCKANDEPIDPSMLLHIVPSVQPRMTSAVLSEDGELLPPSPLPESEEQSPVASERSIETCEYQRLL